MEPTSGLIGDIQGTELPTAPVAQQEEAINELKRKAKYSRSKEFAELREKMEARIEFYKQYLPDGTPAAMLNPAEASRNWALANVVIAELQQVIDMYQNADEELKAINERLK